MSVKLVWTLVQVGVPVVVSVPGSSHPDQASNTPRSFGVATRSTIAPSGRANKQRAHLSAGMNEKNGWSMLNGSVQEIVMAVAMLLVPVTVPPGQRELQRPNGQ